MVRARSRTNSRPSGSGSLFANKAAWISGAIILIILIQIFVFRDEGLYTLLKLKQEIEEMESHIQRLEIEKAALESERDRLLNDPEYLERIAREKFRMAKPGEKVFHVVIESKKTDEMP
jgi:cell division protein FtsB